MSFDYVIRLNGDHVKAYDIAKWLIEVHGLEGHVDFVWTVRSLSYYETDNIEFGFKDQRYSILTTLTWV